MILKSLGYVLLLLLSGCSITINGYIIEKAEKICEDKKGVHHLEDTLIRYFVRCGNGQYFSVSLSGSDTKVLEIK